MTGDAVKVTFAPWQTLLALAAIVTEGVTEFVMETGDEEAEPL